MVKDGGFGIRGAGRPYCGGSASENDVMPYPDSGATRRRRLLAAVQGRPLDEAYLHQSIRADLEAEAEAGEGGDGLLTPDMLDHLRELVAAKAGAGPGPGAGATGGAGVELFCSTDAVVIVPGFLASSLSDAGARGLGLIWVSPALIVSNDLGALQLGPYDGTEADLDPRVRIVPTGALPILYDLLRLALEARRYTTEIFAVDWRKDIDMAARRLAARLRSMAVGPRPIHVVAHSQGALVARRALEYLGPEDSLRIVRNLVLLGPANFGSFSAALALGGGHSMLPLARRLGIEPPQGFQQILASMTGLYQLIPWDAARVPWLADNDLGAARFWRGGIDYARLDRFHRWGRGVDSSFFNERTAMIVGDNHGTPTVAAVAFDGPTLRDLPEFALAGDGTVPHSCSVLPGVRTYLAPGTEHSMLAAERSVIHAVLDVLAGRPLGLPEFPSDPAAHLVPGAAVRSLLAFEARQLAADAARRPDGGTPRRLEAGPAHRPGAGAGAARPPEDGPPRPREPGPAPGPELNGAFLVSSYDVRRAEPQVGFELHRREQLREDERTLELQSAPAPAGRDARLPNLELILDASNLLPFDFLRTGDRLGRAVVKVQRGDGAAGTGFLVAPGILLTNNHVLPDAATAAAATVTSNYEISPPSDQLGLQHTAPLDPKDLFLTNADLDFTFCAVRGLESLGVVPLSRNSLNVMKSEYVNIIQHPRGRPKEIVLQDNRVIRADNVVLQYSCDTEPGSSGSPVFNNQWRLVALHHASVVVSEQDGRRAPDANPDARYLNEGIRLSAIATWLETSEANTADRRAMVTRLLATFRGLDPQIGFFGALGRKADGKGAAEIVIESYRGGADDLDLAYWDLRGFDLVFRDRIGEIARVVADMRMDLWCLAHAGAEAVRALCDHLETNFQLDYAILIDPDPAQAGVAILYRKSRVVTVGLLAAAAGVPPGATARLATRRGEVVPFHIVPVGPGGSSGARGRALIEAIGRHPGPAADWVLLGATDALNVPHEVYARAGHEPLALASGHDGAIVLLLAPGSPVDQVFASPNLDPVGDRPDFLVVVRDRDLPRAVETLGGPSPVALRLAVGRRVPPPAPPKAEPAPPPTPAPAAFDDAALEQRLQAILGPMLAKMLGQLPGPK